MQPIRRILVPVDLSKSSISALDWAISFAREGDAEIDLLHCYAISPLVAIYGQRFPDSYEVALRHAAAAGVADLAHRVAGQGVRVREHLVRGEPSGSIVERAESLGSDLIAMGTQGRRGLQHALLGSIAERVIQTAPCPVVAVRCEPGS